MSLATLLVVAPVEASTQTLDQGHLFLPDVGRPIQSSPWATFLILRRPEDHHQLVLRQTRARSSSLLP